MKRASSLLGLAIVLFLLPPSLSSVLAQSKPIRDHIVEAFTEAGPETLDELFSKSSLILQGIITGERPADYLIVGGDPKGPPGYPRTAYKVHVTEFFRTSVPNTAPNTTVEILLPGGRRDRGTYVEDYYDRAFPTPKLGEEYVLFLKLGTTPQTQGWWVPTQGLQESVFLATSGKVVPRGNGPVARLFKDKPVKDLQDVLRKHGGRL